MRDLKTPSRIASDPTVKYVVQLQKRDPCWLAPWGGDPGRTTVLDNARLFDTLEQASRSLVRLKKKWPLRGFRTASVVPVDVTEEEDDV